MFWFYIIDANFQVFLFCYFAYIICKMGWKFKSKDEINALAARLKLHRKQRQLTLQRLELLAGVNCGQLSRFESGKFRTASTNLQKICDILQISLSLEQSQQDVAPTSVAVRMARFAARSPEHFAAAEDILRALERLG